MQVTSLLFDLDGTISDPKEGIVRSINHALTAHGYDEQPEAELLRFIGPPLDRAFTSLTGASDDTQIRALVASYRERYAAVGFSENTLYPGMVALIQQLSAVEGLSLGICTSKRADFAERILEMFSLRRYFSFISGGDVGVSKSDQIKTLLDSATITAASLMIGDRDVDILAAHNNGLPAAGVLWGYGSLVELEGQAPRYLLREPADIWAVVSEVAP